MNSIVENWKNLKKRILDSEMENKRYVLNFWEKEGIIKPYSKLALGDLSCDICLDRDVFDMVTGEYCGHIHVNVQEMVYGR